MRMTLLITALSYSSLIVAIEASALSSATLKNEVSSEKNTCNNAQDSTDELGGLCSEVYKIVNPVRALPSACKSSDDLERRDQCSDTYTKCMVDAGWQQNPGGCGINPGTGPSTEFACVAAAICDMNYVLCNKCLQ